MSNPSVFNIAKEKEAVLFTLRKKGIHVVESETSIVLDISGSEEQFYLDGTIQRALNRILPVPLACDINGNIDTVFFSNSAVVAQPLTEANFANYIENALKGRGVAAIKFNGTAYAEALEALVELYHLEDHEHGEEEHEETQSHGLLYDLGVALGFIEPVDTHHGEEHEEGEHGHDEHDEHGGEGRHICWFVTDGRNQDQDETTEILEELRHDNAQIYFVFVTVGDEDFSYVKRVADRMPNVAMVSIQDLSRFADDIDGTAYDLLTPPELCQWLKHDHGAHEHH